jgi:BirA family biotin operon repressor/biotin-[acetyl-CoA-carboxylase] ligase
MPWTPAEAAPDPVLTHVFAACLPGRRLAGPLRAYRSIPSTQTVARAWADAGAPEGAVVLADYQTAGRGRRGRAWSAPAGRALLLSLVLRPTIPLARWPEIGLAAGCAVAEGIEGASDVVPQLKWPNDVLVDGRKVAGVLAEGAAGPSPFVILGIGVNVSQADGEWPPELVERATALVTHAPGIQRVPLLTAILARLATWYDVLLAHGFEPVRAAWRRRAALGGRVGPPGPPGVTVDLAPDGGLVVRGDDGRTRVIVAGDVDEWSGVSPSLTRVPVP